MTQIVRFLVYLPETLAQDTMSDNYDRISECFFQMDPVNSKLVAHFSVAHFTIYQIVASLKFHGGIRGYHLFGKPGNVRDFDS